MWPYSETEAQWLCGENIEPEDISPEMLQAYIRKAERLRSEMMAHYMLVLPRAISGAVRSAFRRAGRASAALSAAQMINR
jgi:hypothetical protein